MDHPGHPGRVGPVRVAETLCRLAPDGLASSRQLRAAGLSRSRLSRAVAAGAVVRVLPRVYATGPLVAWPSLLVRDDRPTAEHVLHVRAVLLSAGPRACAAGRTAAAVHGWGLLAEPLGVVDVLMPHGSRVLEIRRARVRQRRGLRAEQIAPVPGLGPIRVLDVVETVLDCCRTLPHLEAVVVVDSALRSGAVTLDRLRGAALARGRSRRVLRVLEAADPRSGSVLETVLRVRLQETGIGGWTTQQVVRSSRGRHVLRADFCFAAARLVVAADGTGTSPGTGRSTTPWRRRGGGSCASPGPRWCTTRPGSSRSSALR